jgi:hypothetical protein
MARTVLRGKLISQSARATRRTTHAPDGLWISRIRVLEHGVRGGLHSSARKTLEVVLTHRRVDAISVGVDRMQRNFEPMRKQLEAWQRSELTDATAKVVTYEAFVEGRLEAPNTLPAACMTCTSNRNTTNSGRGRSGVSRMRSLRRSKNWIYPTIPGSGETGKFS